MTLKELERKGVKGRILTTNFLNFSEPAALKKLHELKNIQLKMFDVRAIEGFHTKGYRRSVPYNYRQLKYDKNCAYDKS
jgi:HKD family nuclease